MEHRITQTHKKLNKTKKNLHVSNVNDQQHVYRRRRRRKELAKRLFVFENVFFFCFLFIGLMENETKPKQTNPNIESKHELKLYM